MNFIIDGWINDEYNFNRKTRGRRIARESEDMKMKMMKKLLALSLALVLVLSLSVSALACTSIYVGSDLTEDGDAYFARSEDISNSYNKVFYVSPAGNHKAGDAFSGCYGFEYTFEKDSYAYTAFRDDNLAGVCPDCGSDHDHTPYEAAGTNEKGVSMTATVTIGPNEAIYGADPYLDAGIEEAEIVTVVLSQADSAKDALDILMGIYDEYGAAGGSSILIGDKDEVWYIENCSGTQYIAMKLPSDMVFINPNISVIGLIDLDDENVIASDGLIETAVNAGTFVGDEEANQIDFRASYSSGGYGTRLFNGLAYLNDAYDYTEETIADTDFCLSNVKDGEMVGLYTNIEVDHPFTTADVLDFYKTDAICRDANLDIHVFQLDADAPVETGTVEWVAMGDGAYTVFVPYWPLLIKDTYEAYQVTVGEAEFTEEEPDGSAPYYPKTMRDGTEGFMVQPADWADSMYWSFDVVSNYVLYVDESQQQTVKDAYAALQADIYADWADVTADAAAAEDMDALADTVTAASEAMAQQAHQTAVDLYGQISGK